MIKVMKYFFGMEKLNIFVASNFEVLIVKKLQHGKS